MLQENTEKDFVDYVNGQMEKCSLDDKDMTTENCQALFGIAVK